jgi:hypothetical protein
MGKLGNKNNGRMKASDEDQGPHRSVEQIIIIIIIIIIILLLLLWGRRR